MKLKKFQNIFRRYFVAITLATIAVFTLWQLSNLREFTYLDTALFKNNLRSGYNKYIQKSLFSRLKSETKCQAIVKNSDLRLIPERITIPRIGLDLPVVIAPFENGTWPVNDKVANWAEGTSLVNADQGNVGIFGHDRPDAFSLIKKLIAGDEIFVYSGDYVTRYQANVELIVDPKQTNIFYPAKGPILTLVTCNGKFSEKRFIAQADLISIEKRSCEN